MEKVKKIAIRFLIRLLIVVLVLGVIIGGAMWYYLSKNYDADMEAIEKFNYGKHTIKEEGKTMVVVTHEMGFARHVSTHVIFLHQGKIEEEGAPEQLFGNPQSPRLQQFLKGSLK